MHYNIASIPPKRLLILQMACGLGPMLILFVSFRFPVAHPDPPRLMSLPYQLVFILSMAVFSRMFGVDGPARWIVRTIGKLLRIPRRDLVDPSEWLAEKTEGFIDYYFKTDSGNQATQPAAKQLEPRMAETEQQKLEKKKRLIKLMEEEDARRRAAAQARNQPATETSSHKSQ